MSLNVKFIGGRVHKIDSLGLRTKLKCGLVAKGFISLNRQWFFTYKKIDCENCLRKMGKPNATDLSNYHSFIKE
jgi:hypothetical protein